MEDILKKLKIDPNEGNAIVINGKVVSRSVVLHEGDCLSLIPPLGGG